ncbi:MULTISPECIES: DUF1330 domain-containing protein [unclassified Pseudomonas]|uniref:DUF1330 domain-containing protein n=1 Tax=unclassified Pseudomonas TaxID=196821 RepID=UPI000871A387|nr:MULTISPECIES: DUF1330 domain-containing protein [unclassified Pseudomonas]SCW35757.1 Uncharacterized conserved protein, DUF1330 family [Pseudomonas sp. NFACC56-3]SFK16458.1 Uncharacterized conserved protein, DUF1330 family [Pseudomonas sp. NFACC52]
MTAYFLAFGTVKDPEKLAEYIERSGPSVAHHGGKYVGVDEQTVVLLGKHKHPRTALFTFPDSASCQAWFDSASYQKLEGLREDAGDFVFIVFDV